MLDTKLESKPLDPELLLRWVKTAEQERSSWLANAKKDRAYYEGEQWTPEEKAKVEALGQSALTINHLWSKINGLVGMLLRQKPTIKCLPRGKHDAKFASTATSVIRYVLDINSYESVLTEIFTDTVTVGIGYGEVSITNDFTKDPIVFNYIPWDEVIYDHLSRQPDFSDARFVARARWVEAELLEAQFPEASDALRRLRHDSRITAEPTTPYDRPYDPDRDMVLVTEVQYKTYADKDCIFDGLQAEIYVPKLHDPLLQTGLIQRQIMNVPVIRRALFFGDVLIEDIELPYVFNQFTIVPFCAWRRKKDGSPLSLVSIVRDIQDEINVRRSKVLHYLQLRTILAEEGAIVDPDNTTRELNRPDGIVYYRKNYKIELIDGLQMGAHHLQLLQQAVDELTLITGIMPDFVGEPTNARTGAALRTRILQSQNSVLKYFSTLERGLKAVAERILALAKQFYDPMRIMSILDDSPEFGAPVEPVAGSKGMELEIRNTLASMRADIVVKVTPGGSTERQETLAYLTEVFKVLPPELLMMSMDIIIDMFDLPEKAEIKKRYQMLLVSMMQARQNQAQGGNNNDRGRSEADGETPQRADDRGGVS